MEAYLSVKLSLNCKYMHRTTSSLKGLASFMKYMLFIKKEVGNMKYMLFIKKRGRKIQILESIC